MSLYEGTQMKFWSRIWRKKSLQHQTTVLEMEHLQEFAVGPAIHVKDANKRYANHQALDGMELSVQPGTIYGLLGPSGCGKTTLVNCIVGRCYLDSGSISVDVNDLKDIGYMPQDISLHNFLSIGEIIRFYGYLYEMEAHEVTDRFSYLSRILELPPPNRCISSLSGGQQRRVSLAVALLHNPKILILDEPTVGLDPILCKNFWDRLREMSLEGTTIILTTHYIEEARQADMIGLMRRGRMLTQNTPSNLLREHNAEYLEDVFLKLCYKEEESPIRQVDAGRPCQEKTRIFDKPKKFSISRLKASLLKDFYTSKRNIEMTIFAIVIPVILGLCAKLATGDPTYLPLAIVNRELEGSLQNCPKTFTNSCILTNSEMMASCVFVNELRNRTYQLKEYTKYEDAYEDHRKNRNKGIVVFSSNFTESLSERLRNTWETDEAVLDSSSIEVLVDNTEMAIRTQVQKDLIGALGKMMENTVDVCTDVQPGAYNIPIQIDPIFGDKNWNLFAGFQIGFNIMNILINIVGFSAATMLDEKNEGSLDRVLSVGMSMWEIMVGHIMQHSVFAVIYAAEAYFLMFYVFGQPQLGSPCLVMAVFIFTGLTGVFIGGSMGLLTKRIIEAENATSAFNFGFICLTGLMWPIEGAHKAIRPFLPYLPMTSTIDTVRNISIKGYGLMTPMVAKGLAQVVFWMLLALMIEILIIKTRKGTWNTSK